MPVLVVEPDLDYIPGSPGPSTQVSFGGQTVFGDDALTFESLWPGTASARRGPVTIALTYDAALSRVRITAEGLNPATAVTVERSTNQIAWTVVRGSPVAVNVNSIALDDYEFVPNVVNYYRLRPATPPGGMYLPGLAGRYASTPDDTSLDITGDVDLRADVTLANWSTLAQVLVGKWDANTNQRSYRLGVTSTGALQAFLSVDGTATLNAISTVNPTPASSGRLAVRTQVDVDNGAGGWTATFATAPTIDGPWTQLGAPVITATATSIFNSTAAVEVGSANGGTFNLVNGTVHAAEVRNAINGTAVANPNFAAQATFATSFTDTAGRTWSIPEDAPIFGPTLATASITPSQTAIWLKSVPRPFLNLTVSLLGNTFSVERADRGAAFAVVGRSLPIAVTDVRGSRQYTLKMRTDTDDAAANLDLLLASGDILFLQAPAGSVVPSGGVFLMAGRVAEEHPIPPDPMRFTSADVIEVAAPGAGVVGTTVTCQTVLNTYATCADVLAANATCADLLNLVGSPSEIVVP